MVVSHSNSSKLCNVILTVCCWSSFWILFVLKPKMTLCFYPWFKPLSCSQQIFQQITKPYISEEPSLTWDAGLSLFPTHYLRHLDIFVEKAFFVSIYYSAQKRFIPETWQQSKAHIHSLSVVRFGKFVRNSLTLLADFWHVDIDNWLNDQIQTSWLVLEQLR